MRQSLQRSTRIRLPVVVEPSAVGDRGRQVDARQGLQERQHSCHGIFAQGAQRRHVAAWMAVECDVQNFGGALPRRIAQWRHLPQAGAIETMAGRADRGKNLFRGTQGGLGTPRGLDHLLHVSLATTDEVGQVDPVAFVQEVFVAVIGILQQRSNGRGVGVLPAADADDAVIALVVPAVTFHTAPGIGGGNAYLPGLEGRIRVRRLPLLRLAAPVVVEPAATHDRRRVDRNGLRRSEA
jgi:hypothetical protein